MRKFYYSFEDWGIFSVVEVEVLDADVNDEKFPGQKLARVRPIDAKKFRVGPNGFLVSAKLLFDTREEADRYGRENCPAGAF